MSNKLYGWALVGLVLIFGVGAIIAYLRNHERANSIPNAANLAVYDNQTYGYSFYYPPTYTVRVRTDEQAIIGLATTSGFVTYAEARIATSSSEATYDDFLIAASKDLCTALPGYSCTGVANRSTYTTETNLAGTKFYLDMTTSDGTSQRFGPVYAFNVGGNVTTAKYATLLVYRPLGATGEVEKFPAEDIARRVGITKVERR
jgi:hypothetical protein